MYRETLYEAIHAGAAEFLRFFNGSFTISHKEGVNNLVTEADHASDAAIQAVIRKNFPEHSILSEETAEKVSSTEFKWIIDPIDGTVNFANGIPICCISVALEQNGTVIMGAVYNPVLREFFFAQRGLGATLNDQPIHVSAASRVLTSCLVTGFPYTYINQPNGPLEVFGRLIREGVPVRRLGSAAIDLCWVAAGRFDGFYEHQLNAWDSAAGFLVVEEAGGRVTNLSGKPYSLYQPGIVATNGRIHDELLEWIAGTPINVKQATGT